MAGQRFNKKSVEQLKDQFGLNEDHTDRTDAHERSPVPFGPTQLRALTLEQHVVQLGGAIGGLVEAAVVDGVASGHAMRLLVMLALGRPIVDDALGGLLAVALVLAVAVQKLPVAMALAVVVMAIAVVVAVVVAAVTVVAVVVIATVVAVAVALVFGDVSGGQQLGIAGGPRDQDGVGRPVGEADLRQ